MRIALVTPAPRGSRHGNRITALRWRSFLRDLGHAVHLYETLRDDVPIDLLVALHARRSAPSVRAYRARHPKGPLVVALTGTDAYADLPAGDPEARQSLDDADAIVTLQQSAKEALPFPWRKKAHVILQSATPPRAPRSVRQDRFEISVIAHIREVKDPLLAAKAVRSLPQHSNVLVLHIGHPLDQDLAAKVLAESTQNPRYAWLGPKTHDETKNFLAGSRALLLTSRMEGGANVVSEALVAGVPVLSTRIPGSVALLGENYPGYFPVGDAEELARLLLTLESDPSFLQSLQHHAAVRADRFAPREERRAWATLLQSLAP